MMIGDRQLEPPDTSAEDEAYERWCEAEATPDARRLLANRILASIELPPTLICGSHRAEASLAIRAAIDTIGRDCAAHWRVAYELAQPFVWPPEKDVP